MNEKNLEKMVKEKIKVAFIYKPSQPYFSPNYYDTAAYNFFWLALNRNQELDVTYFPSEDNFDIKQLDKKYDIILLPNNFPSFVPNLIGIGQSKIPVICRTGDFHYAKRYNQFQYHEKFKIDYYFNFMSEKYFYKFYPKEYKYETIVFGIEPQFFKNLKPFSERIKYKILNTGQVGNKKLRSRVINRVIHPKRSNWYFYKLRTVCNDLPYVVKQTLGKDNPEMKNKNFTGNNYYEFLSGYRTGIAATTFYPTAKYWEIPAAGCLTFMEITNVNYGDYLGFVDKRNAIFINESNYKDKFNEYLKNPDDSEWEKIASAGRDYVLNNLTNDHAVEKLVNVMKKLI